MKTFTFLAKQGQHNQIAKLLNAKFGKPHLEQYNAPRGQGVMISLTLPPNVSKKSVDRYLHDAMVPGAVSGRNRFRIFKMKDWLDHYKINDQIGTGVQCIVVIGGKMIRGMVEYYDFGCTCCGGYFRFVDRKGKPV